MRDRANPNYPVTVYYAFKQSEEDENHGNGNVAIASTGWTMLEGLINSGFSITGTWPMRQDNAARAASASGQTLLHHPLFSFAAREQRKRRWQQGASLSPRCAVSYRMLSRNFNTATLRRLTLHKLQSGRGLQSWRYSKVIEPDGDAMRVRKALQLINEELDAYFTEQEGELDPDTRFCIAWFEQRAMELGSFGEADVLARAKNTAVEGLVAPVCLKLAQEAGLLKREEYPEDWNPAEDRKLTVWEGTQHLIRALEKGGEEVAARLANQLGGGRSEEARALAYRLYAICERKVGRRKLWLTTRWLPRGLMCRQKLRA